jgi:hypothetical protein
MEMACIQVAEMEKGEQEDQSSPQGKGVSDKLLPDGPQSV